MKKTTLLLMIICVLFELKAQNITNTVTVYTPRNSPVTGNVREEGRLNYERLNDDYIYSCYNGVIEIIKNYPGSDGISSTYKFNCHSYTWLRSEGNIIDCWLEPPCPCPPGSDVDAFTRDGSYIQVPRAVQGAKVVFDNGNHSAIIPGSDTFIYVSKQTQYPLMKHYWDYPNSYSRKYYVKPNSLSIDGPAYISSPTVYTLDISPGQINQWSFLSNNGFTGATGNNTTVTISPPNPQTGQQAMLRVVLNNGHTIDKNITALLPIVGPATICAGKQAVYSVSNPPNSFSWAKSGNLTTGTPNGNTYSVTASTTTGSASVSIVSGGNTVATKNISVVAVPASRSITGYPYRCDQNNRHS